MNSDSSSFIKGFDDIVKLVVPRTASTSGISSMISSHTAVPDILTSSTQKNLSPYAAISECWKCSLWRMDEAQVLTTAASASVSSFYDGIAVLTRHTQHFSESARFCHIQEI